MTNDCAQSTQATILVIDDEELMRTLIVEMLKREGKATIPVRNGDEGLEVYQTRWEDIDLVILDYILPGRSAAEMIQDLRSINPNVKVMLSTGLQEQQVGELTANESVVGFIQKPFDINDLSAAVKKALEG